MDACRGQRGRGSGGGRGRGRGGGRGRERRGRRGGRTLGRGGDGTPRNQPELKLRFRDLQALENKTSDEINLQLTSSQCFPATECLLKQQSMEGHWIVLIVSIVAKAYDCSPKEDLFKLLNLLPGSSFLNLLLRRYLNKLSADSLPPSDVAVFLRNVVKIMNELLRRFPSCYADLPLSDIYCGTMRLSVSGQLADDDLVTEVDEIIKFRIKKAEDLRKKEEEKRQKRRKPRRHAGVNEDLKKAPEGGSTVPCAIRLECGHVCDMVCHPKDPEHKEYKYNKPCAKTLCARKHKCTRRCYQECGPCMELVTKILPRCGHAQNVACSKDPVEVNCQSPCSKLLSCGHQCKKKCFEECSVRCTVITEKAWPCGHENETECYVNPLLSPWT